MYTPENPALNTPVESSEHFNYISTLTQVNNFKKLPKSLSIREVTVSVNYYKKTKESNS